MNRTQTFKLALAYLLALLILGVLYALTVLAFVPDTFVSVPVAVPWFGAVGAVLISLTGVFEHEHDWDDNYWPWHVARPFIGASLGVVSVLIFKAGILAVGSTPSPSPSIPTNLLYYVIAFLVGYREETFRELIKRLADVLLTPGPGGGGVAMPTITALDPPDVPHAPQQQVKISGSGFTNTQSIRFGTRVATQFTVNADGLLTVMTPDGLAGGEDMPLTVTTKSGSATHPVHIV
jgi:IPT/TIG domain